MIYNFQAKACNTCKLHLLNKFLQLSYRKHIQNYSICTGLRTPHIHKASQILKKRNLHNL